MIHEYINPKSGRSELFNKEKLEVLKIEKCNDLFLLFLPNFSMHTPFHFLLTNGYYEIFNRLSNSIGTDMFNDFMKQTKNIKKIIDMFNYIHENVSIYPKKAIDMNFCVLTQHDEDDCGEDDDTGKTTRLNIIKIEEFLMEINKNVQENLYFA